jgi:hypothetical protein
MNIKEWFANGCNYDDGVAIYATLQTAKPNLLQLFKRKKTASFLEKLKYELSKHKDDVSSFTPLQIVKEKKENTAITLHKEPPAYKPVLISDFPVALHPVYIQQKNDFAIACSLKIQLNNLPAEDEETALKLCLEIDRLFNAIELAWKKLDHYTAHKTILEVQTNDFSGLTPAQQIQRRNTKRSNLTKAKKRLEVLRSRASLNKSQQTKKEVAIEKQLSKINQIEEDILTLTNLINAK